MKTVKKKQDEKLCINQKVYKLQNIVINNDIFKLPRARFKLKISMFKNVLCGFLNGN